MKKQHTYKDMSTKLCRICGKPLKMNLVIKNPAADKCFKCHHKGKKERVHHEKKA